MLIKDRDSREADIGELTALLQLPLPANTRFLVERELRCIRSGVKGEKDAAYFIDSYYGRSERWAVLHDLRIELLGQTAQIDHLLINRFFDMYVLESKNFSFGLKITETGEFLAGTVRSYVAIESPIEQNRRHVFLLEKVLGAKDMMPSRLGMSITPSMKSYVLISPASRLIRPASGTFDTSMVIKADTLRTVIEDYVEGISAVSALTTISKMASKVAMMDVARKIAALHRPAQTDYRKRFGIGEITAARTGGYYCSNCRKDITQKAASFCWENRERFGGRAYCFECQKVFLPTGSGTGPRKREH